MNAAQNTIKVRARLVIINEGKLLVTYDSQEDYYFYVGGKLEFGETLAECCIREVKEECGDDVNFTFDKILYIRDFLLPNEAEHSVELFILGTINKFEELEKRLDPQDEGRRWLTWLDLAKLPSNLKPASLTSKLIKDYQGNFPSQGEYLGSI